MICLICLCSKVIFDFKIQELFKKVHILIHKNDDKRPNMSKPISENKFLTYLIEYEGQSQTAG